METLEHLKRKNQLHNKLVAAERNSMIPIVINFLFVIVLIEFEIIEMFSSGLSLAVVFTILFLYLVYNIMILTFCAYYFKNLLLRCTALVVIHLGLIYLWIVQGDKWSVAYMLGLFLVVMTFKSLYEISMRKT